MEVCCQCRQFFRSIHIFPARQDVIFHQSSSQIIEGAKTKNKDTYRGIVFIKIRYKVFRYKGWFTQELGVISAIFLMAICSHFMYIL